MIQHNLDLIDKQYSEKVLEKNIHLFDLDDWNYISFCQKLSEKFIEKYSDNVYWPWISRNQNLSEEFIIKNINKIDIKYLMNNGNVSEKTKQEINLLKEII
jgi:ABC-type iron transport system FetAB ATPase subunit